MSANIHQIYIANPITTNASTDLMYFGQSPYTSGKDAAMTYANFAAQFGAPYTPAALTRTNDTNVTLTLGGTPTTSLLQSVSLTLGWTGQLALTKGGLNASLTASNGGIFYSTATGGAILSATTTANQIILSGASAAPSWSTATYPATTTINQILFSSAANTITGISSVNSAVMITSSGGVPSFSTTLPAGLTIPGYGVSSWVDETSSTVTMTTNTGYTSDDGASLVTFTLPSTAAIGDFVEINGKGSGGWSIAQATGQQIHFGSTASTSGASGSVSSTNLYDCIRLRCITANTIFVVVSAIGNLTVV